MNRHIRTCDSAPQRLSLAIIDDDHLCSEYMEGTGSCRAAYHRSQVHSPQRRTRAEVPDQGSPYGAISARDDNVHYVASIRCNGASRVLMGRPWLQAPAQGCAVQVRHAEAPAPSRAYSLRASRMSP